MLILILVTGCSNLPKELQIFTTEVEKTKLDLPNPPPLQLEKIQWRIVTIDNVEEILKNLHTQGNDPVIIGLTDKGYQTLSENMKKTMNYIMLQKEILDQYRNYYEPRDGDRRSSDTDDK